MTPNERHAELDQREIALEEGFARLEQCEVLVEQREHAAQIREVLANERERAADAREVLADQRERAADHRELVADERERAADERQRQLDKLEQRMDRRARRSGITAPTIDERALEAIERGRALLEASAAALDRSEAALRRGRARSEREHLSREQAVAVEQLRAAGGTIPDPDPDGPQVPPPMTNLDGVARVAQRVAEAEEDEARRQDELARLRPWGAVQHRRLAAAARDGAIHARDIANRYRSTMGVDRADGEEDPSHSPTTDP